MLESAENKYEEVLKVANAEYVRSKEDFQKYKGLADTAQRAMNKWKKIVDAGTPTNGEVISNILDQRRIKDSRPAQIEKYAIECIQNDDAPKKIAELYKYYISVTSDKGIEANHYSSRLASIRQKNETIICEKFKGKIHGDGIVYGTPEMFTNGKFKPKYKDKFTLTPKKAYIPKSERLTEIYN